VVRPTYDPRAADGAGELVARFDLVIFDCDGVVVDSERIIHEVFDAWLAELGVVVTPDMNELFLGRTLADVLKIVTEKTGRMVPKSALDGYLERRDRVLRESVQPVAGVRGVLEALRTPFCIASSGDHAKMRATLGGTGLLPLFAGKIFSATEVARGKPAPDVFLYAAEKMGAAPERSAVIEDSINGVLAGCAAGMTVLGYSDLIAASRLAAAAAHATFTQMSELPALLR
jgi:HAD superfamily hydrolase (TIGR01509 family)